MRTRALVAAPELPARYVRDGLCESYGSLRYGKLFEALLYDCRRNLSNRLDPLTGDAHSGFVPPDLEAWINARAAGSDAQHLVQMPSTPILWSVGKWGEWYPDVRDDEGRFRANGEKPWWPRGWNEQHERIVRTTADRADRTPLFVSGDLHAIGAGRIHASNGQALSRPVESVLCGPVSTGALGWPSKFRGLPPAISGTLDAEESVPAIEENGFSLIDVEPHELRVSFFRWTPDRPADEIERLEPFAVETYPRPGA